MICTDEQSFLEKKSLEINIPKHVWFYKEESQRVQCS